MNKTTAYNPYLPGYEYVPDGEPYVFGDRVYIYGSHDLSFGTAFCQGNYVCWSAPVDDLGAWRYEGVIYEKTQDPYNEDGSHELYAPDVVIGPDGRYYLYYALDSVGRMSVAVCDEPAGKYEFYGFVHYKNEDGTEKILTENYPFDPGVLLDDDGRVYMYYGFCMGFSLEDIPQDVLRQQEESQQDNPIQIPENFMMMFENTRGGLVLELEPDMITVIGTPKTVVPNNKNSIGTDFEGHGFFEASSIRKINDTYYFIYSSFKSQELCYATSKYPDKDFQYGGTIVSNGDIGLNGRKDEDNVYPTGNNHGSIVKIKDKWYVFYHRHTQSTSFSRQGCAEEIQILEDGSIPQVEITSCGLNGGPLAGKGTYSAHICCNLSTKAPVDPMRQKMEKEANAYVYEEVTGPQEADRNQYVANIKDGVQIGYKYFCFEGSQSEIEIGVRGKAEGELKVYIDGADTDFMTGKLGSLVAGIPIDVKDEKEWKNISARTETMQGIHSLYFVYTGVGYIDLNSFSFR